MSDVSASLSAMCMLDKYKAKFDLQTRHHHPSLFVLNSYVTLQVILAYTACDVGISQWRYHHILCRKLAGLSLR